MDRKFQEIAISLELTEKYSKEQIMEFYVNNVFFANGYYGIEAAAQGYFSKPASELTLSETAYLCAIPNSPSRYNPYNDKNRAVDRRDLILDAMYEVGFISWEDMEQAKNEEIRINEPNNMAGGYEAVSYTHLDVYKRQLIHLPWERLQSTRLSLIIPAMDQMRRSIWCQTKRSKKIRRLKTQGKTGQSFTSGLIFRWQT